MKRFRTLAVLLALAFLGWTVSSGDDGPDHRARQQLPIKLGTSGGPSNDFDPTFLSGEHCVNGTLGSAVTCNGVLHVLTNSHVLCRAPVGQEVLQPGLWDTQCQPTGNVVAHTVGDLVPFAESNVDAAIALAVPGAVDPSGEILDIGVPCANPVEPRIGMAVAKSGRATGLTFGTVQAVHLTIFLGFGPGGAQSICPNVDPKIQKKGYVQYNKAFSVAPNSLAAGDSGSLLVTNDASHNPVGTLLGGNPNVSFWSTASQVAEAFEPFCGGPGGFRFVGRTCTTAEFSESSVLAPQGSEVEFARTIKERHVGRLMSDPAILGVGVGTSDRNPNEAVIVVYLERGRRIDRAIPTELDGVRVKMILTDAIVAM
ncbi:MAG: hypothetical protein HY613_10845 [Candidatus Rokubacteria bacterium]|nr:hypothetical protein [Candidatus Rokubacteria bacterium]